MDSDRLTFSRCGVDCDGVVEVSLTGAHFHSDGEALDDLVGTLADDVDANNSFFGTLYDKLEGCRFLVLFFDHAEVKRLEGGFVWAASLTQRGRQTGGEGGCSRTSLDSISIPLSSLRLGQTNGSDRRVTEWKQQVDEMHQILKRIRSREDDGGNVVVTEFVILEFGRTKETV